MKWLVFVLAAVCACNRPDDLAALRAEAIALADYYRPVVDQLEQRLHDLDVRGPKLGEHLPGSDEANTSRRGAERMLPAVRELVGTGGSGPSARGKLVEQAERLAANRDPSGLQRLVDSAREDLERETTEINVDLQRAEDWLMSAEAAKRGTP